MVSNATQKHDGQNSHNPMVVFQASIGRFKRKRKIAASKWDSSFLILYIPNETRIKFGILVHSLAVVQLTLSIKGFRLCFFMNRLTLIVLWLSYSFGWTTNWKRYSLLSLIRLLLEWNDRTILIGNRTTYWRASCLCGSFATSLLTLKQQSSLISLTTYDVILPVSRKCLLMKRWSIIKSHHHSSWWLQPAAC